MFGLIKKMLTETNHSSHSSHSNIAPTNLPVNYSCGNQVEEAPMGMGA